MAFKARGESLESASEAGFTFEPKYPKSTEGIGATITVRGPRSRAMRDYAQRKMDEAHARDFAARKRGKPAEPLALEEIEVSILEMAVVCTIGWEGMEDDAGAPLPYSAENARVLYTAHPWIRDQVANEAQDLGNFIKPCSTSCTSTRAPSSAST